MPERTGDVPRAAAWLASKDYKVAWNKLIGRRLQQLREEAELEEEAGAKAAAATSKHRSRRGSSGRTQSSASQAAISASLSRSQAWLSKIELGLRSLAVGEVYLLAQHYGVEPERLLGPPSTAEQKIFDRDLQDIAKDRERAGLTPRDVAKHRSNARNGHHRSTPLNEAEKRKREGLGRAPSGPAL